MLVMFIYLRNVIIKIWNMNITKKILKRIILFAIFLMFAEVFIEFLPFLKNYESLEKELFQGYEVYPVYVFFLILTLIIYFISIGLIYFVKPLGRPLYLIGFIGMVVCMIVSADYVMRSITYPITMLISFVDIFILYIIYLTPLKKEFEKK